MKVVELENAETDRVKECIHYLQKATERAESKEESPIVCVGVVMVDRAGAIYTSTAGGGNQFVFLGALEHLKMNVERMIAEQEADQ